VSGDSERDEVGRPLLLEREEELTAIEASLERTGAETAGRTLLIEGPAGIGKTSLLGRLEDRAIARGFRVMTARGSEIEREFGFGIVRQLFGSVLRPLDQGERSRLFSGPAALAAAIFGMADPGTLEVNAAEASLYGLFWLTAALAEQGPLVFTIDDAHWSDAASLRFVQYLGRRLDGLPLLLCLAARPNEPGPQAQILGEFTADPGTVAISPPLLSEAATATLVGARLAGEASAPVLQACHQATGGNPLLIGELLAALEPGAAGLDAISPDSIAAVGSDRVAAGLIERARLLEPAGPDVLRAVAVLGGADDLRVVAALAGVDQERTIAIVDGLAGAAILSDRDGRGFVHPMFRTAIHEAIPAAARAAAHARAADLVVEFGAASEEAAAHLLLCEPGTAAGALALLDEAARSAADRGAPESAVAYLRRALDEAPDDATRGDLLRRLGRAEVALRDPASIGHLQQAAELAEDQRLALEISLDLAEVLSIAGQWEAAVATIDGALARFAGSGLPAELDLEAMRAAYRGYDPGRIGDYEDALPSLLALVEDRDDDDSSRLRWVLAAIGAIQEMPRDEVLRLIGPADQSWSVSREGRESSLISQGLGSLIMVDAVDEAATIAAALRDEGRSRGSLLAMIAGVGYEAAIEDRRGRLRSSEESLRVVVDLIRDNELSLMALTTVIQLCIDTILERGALDPVAELVEAVELPPPFGETLSGGSLHEVRGALRLARGDRPGAVADLREAERILRPLRAGPRFTLWRSRLALALPAEARAEAVSLAGEELLLATAVESPRATGVALRTLGVLTGGDGGIERLRESVSILATCGAALEQARSLAELGAALRRSNSRSEARDRLREAADLAQRCGAERLERQIVDELRVAGGKPRRLAISGPESLTPAEHRVATAAAGGATNRQIAQDLFVSLRTVETHLSNTYRKLGTPKRGDLAAVLGD
jgi:DNA-binding CsgD family transcriptional regulator/predicted negative regulator of RcsB-dependent stress response